MQSKVASLPKQTSFPIEVFRASFCRDDGSKNQAFVRIGNQLAMDFLTSTRRTPLLHSLAFIALVISIFSWGLGYKLSRYDSPQSNSYQIPKAKLLSKNERAVAEHVALQGEKEAITSSALFFSVSMGTLLSGALLLMLRSPKPSHGEFDWSRIWRSRRVGFNSFFFRPPPLVT
jgi:hypothetical protein